MGRIEILDADRYGDFLILGLQRRSETAELAFLARGELADLLVMQGLLLGESEQWSAEFNWNAAVINRVAGINEPWCTDFEVDGGTSYQQRFELWLDWHGGALPVEDSS